MTAPVKNQSNYMFWRSFVGFNMILFALQVCDRDM